MAQPKVDAFANRSLQHGIEEIRESKENIAMNEFDSSSQMYNVSPCKMADHQEQVTKLTNSTLNYSYPLTLAAQAADTETFHHAMAMQQPDREQFILAMIKEIKDLTKVKVWELECCKDIGQQKVIRAIWSFKQKRLSDGTYLKHKARLCAHGGMQIKGEHYWDMYSPVCAVDDAMVHADCVNTPWPPHVKC